MKIKMDGRRKLAQVAIVLCVLMATVLVMFGSPEVPGSKASAFTTPVASWPHSTDNSKWPIYLWTSDTITASGASEEYKLMNYEALDLHYVIDQGTTNTVTIKLQYSNDGSNWADGAAIVSANVADANEMVQKYNVGAYTRLYATLANSNPITITVIGLAK